MSPDARPSEAITAAVGSVIGAMFIIVGALTDWEVPVEVPGAVITLVSWSAAGVTWWVARKQRAGQLQSGQDGTVQ